MRRAATSLTPQLTADLRLLPKQIEKSYWRYRLARNTTYDTWVVWFNLLILVCIMPSWVSKLGWGKYIATYTPAWLMYLIWLVALHDSSLYAAHRQGIVTFGRAALSLIAGECNRSMKDTIYHVMVLDNPHTTLLYKFLLLGHTFELPFEVWAFHQPFLLQTALLLLRAGCLLFNECTTELIKFSNTPEYVAAAHQLTAGWGSFIRSIMPVTVPACSLLAGRSTAAFLSITVLQFTTVAVVLYTAYMNLWVDVRLWLYAQMQRVEAQRGTGSASSSDVIDIEGTRVSLEQLQAMYSTPAATLLLNFKGVAGGVAICFHAVAIGIVCQLALVMSQVFVLQVFPRFLVSGASFDQHYPVAP